MSATQTETPPAPKQWDVDLWPDGFGQTPWAQESNGGGRACSAYSVGAAVYWVELNKDPTRDPGTPDFAFHYNNEAWLTSDVRKQYRAAEAKGQTSVFVFNNAFWIKDSVRAAAEFGTRFVASPGDALPFTEGVAPPFQAFVDARQHRYSFRHLTGVPKIDPNNPTLPSAPVVPKARHELVCDALRNRTPVVVGIALFPGAPLSALPPTVPTVDSVDSHAILFVGYSDARQEFRFRNSAGTAFGVNGYGTVPYAWIDDPNATFGFFAIEPHDRRFRAPVTLDTLLIGNRGPSATVVVDAYDGARAYLGSLSASVSDAPVRLNPVRWVGTYRLHVKVTPANATTPIAFDMFVDNPNGAVASGAQISLAPDGASPVDAAFLDASGNRIPTAMRTVKPG